MTVSVVQVTFSGDETTVERSRPDTFLWCAETEQWVLRSRRDDWPHDLAERPEDDEEDEEDDAPEQVGAMYDITLSYTVDYRFRVPAYSEHGAKDRAEELTLDAHPADSYLVHTDDREVSSIYSDDPKIPDDWDPYGGTPLWEVWDDE